MDEMKCYEVPGWGKATNWFHEDRGAIARLQKNAGVIFREQYYEKFEAEFHCKLVWDESALPTGVIFESQEHYNWFLLRWA